MRYEEHLPPHRLQDLVEAFWQFALDDSDPAELLHPIVPDGAVSLAGTYWEGALLSVEIVGPAETAQQAQLVRGMHVVGARLCPGACEALLEIRPETLAGRMESLPQSHWAVAAWQQGPGGLDGLATALAERAAALTAPDPQIAAAARRLEAGIAVSDVAAGLGVSPRHLHRRFTRAAGLPPKVWQRVRRHRMAWILHVMGEADSLTDTAHSAGFADSAHFSREARRAFQLPALEVAAYLATIRHGPLRRGPFGPAMHASAIRKTDS